MTTPRTNSIGETISAHDSLEDLPHMGEISAPAGTGGGGEQDEALEIAADIRKLIDSAPAHIWLDLGENIDALADDATFRALSDVTWSEDNATGCGIKYVRASLGTSLRIDFKQATELLAMFGGEQGEITLSITEGHSGPGLYAHYTEYPEEGCEFLGATDSDATPDAALTKNSEATP